MENSSLERPSEKLKCSASSTAVRSELMVILKIGQKPKQAPASYSTVVYSDLFCAVQAINSAAPIKRSMYFMWNFFGNAQLLFQKEGRLVQHIYPTVTVKFGTVC